MFSLTCRIPRRDKVLIKKDQFNLDLLATWINFSIRRIIWSCRSLQYDCGTGQTSSVLSWVYHITKQLNDVAVLQQPQNPFERPIQSRIPLPTSISSTLCLSRIIPGSILVSSAESSAGACSNGFFDRQFAEITGFEAALHKASCFSHDFLSFSIFQLCCYAKFSSSHG